VSQITVVKIKCTIRIEDRNRFKFLYFKYYITNCLINKILYIFLYNKNEINLCHVARTLIYCNWLFVIIVSLSCKKILLFVRGLPKLLTHSACLILLWISLQKSCLKLSMIGTNLADVELTTWPKMWEGRKTNKTL